MTRALSLLALLISALWTQAAVTYTPLVTDAAGKLPPGSKFLDANKAAIVPFVSTNIITAPVGLDSDVETYAAAAGLTDPNALFDLHNFVQGLKIANLWTNLVWASDLRAHHNAGSGSTAYSLKGANGTVNGSPTWNTNGIIFSSNTTQYVEFTNPLQGTAIPAWTIFVAFKANPGYLRVLTSGLNGNSARGISTYAHGSPSSGTGDFKLFQDWGPDGTSYSATTFNLLGRVAPLMAAPGFNQTAVFQYGPTEIAIKSGIDTKWKTTLASPTNAWNNGSVWRLGLTVDGFFPMSGNIAAVFVWNQYLTEAQIRSVRRTYAATIGAGYLPTIELVAEGDSLTAGSNNGETPWSSLLATNSAWGPLISKANIATGGEGSSQTLSQINSQANPILIDRNYFATKQYYALWIGINDLVGSSAATIMTNLNANWAAARSAGYKVIAFTPTPSGNLSSGQQTEYTNLCASIRAATNSFDYLVDLQAVANLNDWRNTNTLFWTDTVHLRDAGQQAVLTNILRVLPTP